MYHNSSKFILTIFLIFALCSCSATTQTTSGEDYLLKYDTVPVASDAKDGVNIEDAIKNVAKVEPVLRFPARIGLARIEQGRLTNIPPEELQGWMDLRDKLADGGFGEFMLVNPMVTSMVTDSVKTKDDSISVINQIRLGSARQHLDAVLIYEVASKSEYHDNLLEIGNLTIIGSYVLPSETVETEGYASAILIDVIQGYPYGTADVTLEKETDHATNGAGYEKSKKIEQEVNTKATLALIPKVGGMFLSLKDELDQLPKKQ